MALAAVLVATNSSEASAAESTQMYEGQEEVHSSQPQENMRRASAAALKLRLLGIASPATSSLQQLISEPELCS